MIFFDFEVMVGHITATALFFLFMEPNTLFLRKPFGLEELGRAVQSLLEGGGS